MIEYIADALIFVFVAFTMLLWHECMHLWSQLGGGKIVLRGFSMICYADTIINYDVFFLFGGVGASLVSFLMMFLSVGMWQFSFFVMGWVNLVYGVYEYLISVYNKVNVRSVRFLLYLVVVVCCVVFWMVV